MDRITSLQVHRVIDTMDASRSSPIPMNQEGRHEHAQTQVPRDTSFTEQRPLMISGMTITLTTNVANT